jgi:hypothetical protein
MTCRDPDQPRQIGTSALTTPRDERLAEIALIARYGARRRAPNGRYGAWELQPATSASIMETTCSGRGMADLVGDNARAA